MNHASSTTSEGTSSATIEGTRSLHVTWEDPMRAAELTRAMSGVAFLEAMRVGEIPAPPIAKLLGFEITRVEEGRVTFECTPGEQHYNPLGIVHGGFFATMLDTALACSIHSKLASGTGYTTLELHVNFVRSATKSTGKLRCEGEVIHVGGRVATAQGRVLDAGGKLYAHATTTCMVFAPR